MNPAGWVDSHCHLGWPGAVRRRRHHARPGPGGRGRGMVCVGTDLESSRRAVDLARLPPRRAGHRRAPPARRFRARRAQWDELVALAEHRPRRRRRDRGGRLRPLLRALAARRAGGRVPTRRSTSRTDSIARSSCTRATRGTTRSASSSITNAACRARTVLHCFTGGPDEARRALDLGAYVSFSGIVSFKNADDVRAAAALVAARSHAGRDRRRRTSRRCRTAGTPNEPAWVVDVGAALAAAVGRPLSEVAEATRRNAATVFGHPA